jgi:hypothetical protein
MAVPKSLDGYTKEDTTKWCSKPGESIVMTSEVVDGAGC